MLSFGIGGDDSSMTERSFLDRHSSSHLSRKRKWDSQFLSLTENADWDSCHIHEYENAGVISLYDEFFNALRTYSLENQVLDLATAFHQSCQKYLLSFKESRKVNSLTIGSKVPPSDSDMIDLLEWERNTWALLLTLYKDRLETLGNDVEDSQMDTSETQIGSNRILYSEKEVISKLYERDSSTREMQLVLDWLERLARMRLEEQYADQFEFYTGQSIAWENTFNLLETKRNRFMNNLTTELDPDAPNRNGKQLSDLDKESEQRLLRYLFLCVRAGDLDRAQQVCMTNGQAWRAATFEGWRLFHDPNISEGSDDPLRQPVEGNPSRDLWKSVCWNMASDDCLSIYEKAIYAAYSGNLDSVLPACETLEDFLWAYFKVILDVKMENEIRGLVVPRGAGADLPDAYWNRDWSIETLFRELEATTKNHLRQTAIFLIVKNVIIGDIGSLVEGIYNEYKIANQSLPKQALRFMAHLIIFFNKLHLEFDTGKGTEILEAYVSLLIRDKETELIAFYVARLPRPRQVSWYSKYLIDIVDRAERERCILLAKDCGLDVSEITRSVVMLIRARGPQPDSRSSSAVDNLNLENAEEKLSSEDRQKIESIEWLIFDPRQRIEALRQTNAVGRYFLAMKKLKGARELIQRLPSDSLTLIHEQHATSTSLSSVGELEPRVANCIREHISLRSYVDAMEAYNEWFEHYYHAAPVAPQSHVSQTGGHGLTFTEKLALEQRLKEYRAEQEHWKHVLDLKAKAVVSKIKGILTSYPGWMMDSCETELGSPKGTEGPDNTEDKVRVHQMTLLRQHCIPALTFLLIKVLHTSEEEIESLRVAEVVSSEEFMLYKLFRKDQLQQLLHMFRTSSLSILDKGLDPMGYSLV